MTTSPPAPCRPWPHQALIEQRRPNCEYLRRAFSVWGADLGLLSGVNARRSLARRRIGRYDIVVEVCDLRENSIIARGSGLGIEWPERLHVWNVIIPVPPTGLLHAGAYDIIVYANGKLVERQRLSAVSLAELGEHGGKEAKDEEDEGQDGPG